MNGARLSVFVILVALLPPQNQHPTFTAKTEAVRLDVSVMRGGRPVSGLRATDFEVMDNGVVQKVDLVSYEQVPLDVVLVLDISDSVRGERVRRLIDASGALLDGLKQDDGVGLLTFNQAIRLRIPPGEDRELARRALAGIDGSGMTSLFDATYAGLALAHSRNRRGAVVLFSDGSDTSSWLTGLDVIDACKRSDVSVYAVTVSAPAQSDLTFLEDATGTTGGRLLKASAGNLRSAFLAILEELKHRYLVSYYPTDAETKGWHPVSVRLKSARGQVTARKGYFR